MKKYLFIILYSAFLGITALAAPARVVVTTSMLESAARDGYRRKAPMKISRIIPPGNCPGHFDIKPQTLLDIRSADLFVYHSYQSGIEGRVKGLGAGVRMIEVPSRGSYLIPSNYWGAVRFLRKKLDNLFSDMERDSGLDACRTEKEILAELERQNKFWRSAAAESGWAQSAVIASAMQAEFCRWLGFDVVGVLPRSENISPARMRELIASEAVLVVGNRQSDAKAAAMLADRKRIPLAVLDNFPRQASDCGDMSMYMRLAEENRRTLEAAWEKR